VHSLARGGVPHRRRQANFSVMAWQPPRTMPPAAYDRSPAPSQPLPARAEWPRSRQAATDRGKTPPKPNKQTVNCLVGYFPACLAATLPPQAADVAACGPDTRFKLVSLDLSSTKHIIRSVGNQIS